MAEPVPPAALRQVAAWLAGEFDRARLYQAAAYAEMAADASGRAVPLPVDRASDLDLDFCLDEHGRVWAIIDGDCHILGRRNAVCAEMSKFLVSVGRGEGA